MLILSLVSSTGFLSAKELSSNFSFKLPMWIRLALGTVILPPILLVVILCLKNGFGRRRCHSKRKLHGKTAIVTGGSAGIGKETCRDFARRGARVILACRNMKKAQAVADSIIASTGNQDVVVYEMDTSDLQSVRNCAKQILEKESRIDILVNNAGIGGSPSRSLTNDGFELTMATNYYGHFLFVNLLIELIKESAPCRIVNVSSEMHMMCLSLDPENLNFEKGFCNIVTSYAQSKLCNMLFNLELANRLKGTGVTANVLHPGLVSTEIFNKVSSWYLVYFNFMTVLFGRSEADGAQTTVHVAVSEEVENVTGKFFDNCQIGSPSALSQDADLAKRLWKASVRDVRLEPHEIKI